MTGLLDDTRAALARAINVYAGTEDGDRLTQLRTRLDEPLRVAVAGRIKAGKSTLLNALVGERLAPTDAGECTRIVTWYADGHTYRVTAEMTDGEQQQLTFHRDEGVIDVDLGGLPPEKVTRLLVTWPSARLRTATLIDTPGIGSLSESVAQRTWDLLSPSDSDTAEAPADAVLYLLRHLHSHDLEFLRAFHDTEVSQPNPVNAIGVLSRADEIGVGKLDSMTSAGKIAARMATDPVVRTVVQTVVPVAGLLAETAATLTETEVAQLRRVAELPVADADALLLTADRFATRMPELGLTSTEREELLDRFGLFGIRLATSVLRHRVAATATELAAVLTERSGVGELNELLRSLFFDRRDVLKSRSVLAALDALTRASPRPGSEAVAADVERIMASAHPFQELRVLSAIRAGWVTGKPAVLDDLEHLIGGAGAGISQRLRLSDDEGHDALVAAAAEALDRWQRRAENPLTRHQLAVAARVAIRSCEGMLSELGRSS
ncbi:dynamin family protein [Haloechinothrix halophila]|uniref:dynamin family protein n=1 Tax=Haloechinothrix halophila TaxID=1069073 RepID=UPI000402DDB5|nr:dynamin family protein [Haloechinothrix halophila]